MAEKLPVTDTDQHAIESVVRVIQLPGVELTPVEVAAEFSVSPEEEQAFQEELEKIYEAERRAVADARDVVIR